MGDSETEYGTVWYQKIDSEEVDGIEGWYQLESKGSEVIVTVNPNKETSVGSGSERILFPWDRIMRIDAHDPPTTGENTSGAPTDA